LRWGAIHLLQAGPEQQKGGNNSFSLRILSDRSAV
jgi:hypothetical protein